MCSAVRQAVAWIVWVGFRPPELGKVEPPMIARFGTSCDIPQRSTTLTFGSSPILVPPYACVLSERAPGAAVQTSAAPAAFSQSTIFFWT